MRGKVTPSLVISVIALIVALGGASYAAIKIPRNSVGANQLRKNSVATPKLRNNAVTSAKVKNGTLKVNDFAASQIPGATWYAQRDTSDLLNVTSEYQAVVTTTQLPAGSYVLSGRANVIGSPAGSTLICSLTSDAAQNFSVAANSMLPLALSGTVTLTEPGTVSLFCSKSAGTPLIAQAYLIASRVPRLVGLPD